MAITEERGLELVRQRYSGHPEAEKFDEMLAGNKIAWRSRLNYSAAIPLIWEIGKPYDEITPDDVTALGASLQGRYKESTAKVRKVMIAAFLKYVLDDEAPKCLKPWRNNKHQPTKVTVLPRGAMDRGTIDRLIRCASELRSDGSGSQRERAFFYCLYESGARIGEFLAMRIRDAEPENNRVRLRGKTGERWVPMHESVPDLVAWINSHPRGRDPDAALWISERGRALAMPTVQQYLNRLKMSYMRSHPDRPLPENVTLHSFRHSRATELGSRLTEAEMKLVFGWGATSRMPATYIHLTGDTAVRKVAEMYGVEPPKKDARDVTETVTCPRCKLNVSKFDHFCGRCSYPLDEKKRKEIEEIEQLAAARPEEDAVVERALDILNQLEERVGILEKMDRVAQAIEKLGGIEQLEAAVEKYADKKQKATMRRDTGGK